MPKKIKLTQKISLVENDNVTFFEEEIIIFAPQVMRKFKVGTTKKNNFKVFL